MCPLRKAGSIVRRAGDIGRVARVMVNNLEEQERMDSVDCLRVVRAQENAPAVRGFRILVLDGIFQSSHCGKAGRRCVVDQHRRMKISRSERFGDMAQVQANLVDAGLVGRIICTNVDFPAVGIEQKMMSGLFVREAHNVVAALHYALLGTRNLGVLEERKSQTKK